MQSLQSKGRRRFLKNAAAIGAGFFIVPRHVLGRGYLAPSDQLTKGIIGVGGMGRGHIPYAGTRVVAICDVDRNHLTEVANSIGGGVKTFHDHRDLIALPEVDIVHIATPPHWHGLIAIDAANAGKDIWCEKPMTRTIGEGQRVIEAVRRNKRMFRLNTWFRFEDNFYGMNTTVKPIKKLVESGLLGWPLTVTVSKTTGFDWKFYWIGKTKLETMPVPPELDYDRWLGPAPMKPYNPHRVHQTFRGYWDYDGGGLGDMGQHYIDPIQYFLGKDHTSPILVEPDAEQQNWDAVGTFRSISFTYEDGCKIILDGEAKDPDAAYIVGPKGKLFAGFRSDIPNLKEKLALLPDPDPQVTNFLDSVKYRTPFALNEMNGFRSCTIINMGKIALQLGRPLKFDPVSQLFIDDTEANYMINPPMRGPWHINTVSKHHFFLFLIVVGFALFADKAGAQKKDDKVMETVRLFPYQHRAEADSALIKMNAWGRSEWKSLFRLLDDDSVKANVADVLSAYVNAAALDTAKKGQTAALIIKYAPVARTNYARLFIRSQLDLLTDKAAIDRQIANLPPLPPYNPPPASALTGERQLLLLEDEIGLVKNPIEKRRVLAMAARIPGFSSFTLVSKSLNDPTVNSDAALIVTRLALADSTIKGPVVREALETALPLLKGEDSAFLREKLQVRLLKMPYDHGFESLFNGTDLRGWKALVGNPITRSKMADTALAAAQRAANEKMKEDWVVKDGLLIFTGHGENLATDKKYRDIEMYVDWKITEKGDAGIYLRGSPQVQIWDTSRREVGAQVGSGGLYNNQKNEGKPLVVADNKIGEWNRFHIIMQGEKVTVWLNGILVTDHITLENYWDRRIPIFPEEQIELQAHGTYVAYRNIYLREIHVDEPAILSEEEKREGFAALFNGLDLSQWTGNTAGYPVRDGVVEVAPEMGGGGNLYTKDEFSNFIYRFEFQLTPGANNGIGIRAPLEGDAAYVGMEIQVLDNEAPMYKNLDPRQYHGSVYGVIPAKRGFLLPTGEWNKEEIIAKGNRIKVTLNGTVILDGDVKEAAAKNGTMDNREHPGLLRTTGHLGFLGHGDVVRFRNMRVKRL